MKGIHNKHNFLCAGPDGETGQPSLWRWLRKSEEPLSQTAAVSGDGETGHITTAT